MAGVAAVRQGLDRVRRHAYSAEIANWAFVGTGHNIVMDTLEKTGLVGMAFVVPLFIIAIRFARSSPIVNQQIAIFGFLIGYFSSSPPPRRPGTSGPTCSCSPSAQ